MSALNRISKTLVAVAIVCVLAAPAWAQQEAEATGDVPISRTWVEVTRRIYVQFDPICFSAFLR